MENRRWDSNEGRKDICARRRTQEGDNTIAPQHPSRRAQKEIKDNRVGYQK